MSIYLLFLLHVKHITHHVFGRTLAKYNYYFPQNSTPHTVCRPDRWWSFSSVRFTTNHRRRRRVHCWYWKHLKGANFASNLLWGFWVCCDGSWAFGHAFNYYYLRCWLLICEEPNGFPIQHIHNRKALQLRFQCKVVSILTSSSSNSIDVFWDSKTIVAFVLM